MTYALISELVFFLVSLKTLGKQPWVHLLLPPTAGLALQWPQHRTRPGYYCPLVGSSVMGWSLLSRAPLHS